MNKNELNLQIKGLGDFGFTGESIEIGPLLIACDTQNKREVPQYLVYGEDPEFEIFSSYKSEEVVNFVFNYLK
jgi:hypothetical protein